MPMKKWLLLPGILLAHTAVFAQSGKGTILGRVFSPDGMPVANVRVVALELPNAKGVSSGEAISTGTTDAEGRYRLSDVPPGRYGVFPNIQFFHDVSARELGTAPAVIVRPGASTVHDVSLRPASGVTVSGRLHGEVFSRHLQEVFLSSENRRLRTDVALDGTFLFRDVVAGTYRVSLPVPQFVWGTKEIRVEGQDITGIELTPDDSIRVEGRVIAEGGGPVPAFSFLLEGPKGSALDSYIWTNDTVRSSGVVGVTGWADRPDDVIFNASLPIGEYRIAVAGLPAGYRVNSFTYGTTDLREMALSLTGEIRQLSISLSPPETLRLVKVRGRLVRDEVLPLEMASERVLLRGNHLLTPLETGIAKDGSFEIAGVPPGVYGVDFPRTGLMLTVGSEGLRGVEFRNSRIRKRYEEFVRLASITLPQSPTVINDAGPQVQREIRARTVVDGSGFPGVNVWLKSIVDKKEFGLFTNGDTQRVPDGDYRVLVSVDDERYQIESVSYGSADLRKEPLRIAGNSEDILVVTVGLKPIKHVTVSGRLTVPLAKRIVNGRIVVEGNHPLPMVALTMRPNVDKGPPFIHPYTMRSAYPTDGGFVLQADGRFAIELPEGRHRLRVDAYPDAYRVKSITNGSANVTRELLEIDGERTKELVITFSAAPGVFWPRVTGRVTGFSAFPVPVRVVLESTRTKFKLEVAPKGDGSFEFPKVPPDKYSVFTAPRVTMMAPTTMVVEGRQVPPLNLTIPTLQTVVMRIAADQGDPPTLPSLSVTFSKTEAYTMLLPALVMRTAGEVVCVLDSCTLSHELAAGAPSVLSASPNDGRYTLRLPEGAYRIDLGRIPPKYELQSFTQGAANLLTEPLRVGPSSPDIVVSLRLR